MPWSKNKKQTEQEQPAIDNNNMPTFDESGYDEPSVGGYDETIKEIPIKPDKNAPYIKAINISGNSLVKTEDILNAMSAKTGMQYDKELIKVNLKEIYNMGYFNEKIKAEMENVRAQLKSKAGMGGMFTTIDDQTVLNNMSADKRERMTKMKQEREDLIKQIEGKVGELKTYISNTVLKDTEDRDNFFTSVAGQRTETKKDEKAKEGSNIASAIADKLYDENGNIRDKNELKKLMDEIKGDKYKPEDREAVLDFIYEQAKDTEKGKLQEKLASKEFFDALTKSDKFPLDNGPRAELLQKTYDKLAGKDGKFAENFEKNNKASWKGYKKAIANAQKADNSSSSGSGASGSGASGSSSGAGLDTQGKDTKKEGVSEEEKAKAASEAARAMSEEIKENKDKPNDYSELLSHKSSISDTLKTMSDSEVIAYFANKENAEKTISACYEDGNDYAAAKEICVRINSILEKYGVSGRIKSCWTSSSSNCVTYTTRADESKFSWFDWEDGALNKLKITTITENSDDDFASCAQRFGLSDTVAPAIYDACMALQAKVH